LKIETDMLDGFEIDHLIINQQRYSIHALPGSGPVPELRQDEILPFRVTGDSMNRAGIQEGDYVLLRLQAEATHNDIVAAEIISADGSEYEAMLKRYLMYDSGKTIILQPESDNS
jgi:phage repressor protein C with HTH and peptisase S24 domain